MLLPQIAAFTLVLAPSLASAAIFPKDSQVKMIDAKGFKKAMKQNETSVVAFVAPWCGHCQRMAPEYSKAAKGLAPMVPLYAVDCDEESNKRLCAEQGVQGFPTVKLFPRGDQKPAISFSDGERTATSFFYWASRAVPDNVKKLSEPDDVPDWVSKKTTKPRALLLNKDLKVPLLWTSLSNKYGSALQFASFHDPKGLTAKRIIGGKKSKKSKVLVYGEGSVEPSLYEGPTKYEALTKFLDSVLDGTADLTPIKSEPAHTPEPESVASPAEEKTVPAETKEAVFPAETPTAEITSEGVTATPEVAVTSSVSVEAETATAEESLTVAASAGATASSVPPKDEL